MTDTNTSSAAAQALQLLITAAQVGDNGALLKLCSDFKPLLSSEARREMFYNSLGKDAEGIAVLAFIELVLKYSGTDYVNWPGYARCRVHFALFDAMQKQGRIWENEIAINTDSEEGTALLDEAGLQQGLPDDIAQLLLSLEVRQALKTADCRTAAGYRAVVFARAETERSSPPAGLQCTQRHQAPAQRAG